MSDKERRRLLPNAVLAAFQAVVTGVLLVVLYKYLLTVIGIKEIGLWSLVLGATSVANVGQMGLSGSALRYVSKHLARDAFDQAAEALETALVSVAVAVGIISLILLPAGRWFLPLLLDGETLRQGLALWPYAVLSLWLSSVGGALQSGLDGTHRADLRSISVIIASLIHLGVVLALVRPYGVMGLAYAQIVRALCEALFNWYWIRRVLPNMSALAWRWSAPTFAEMWRYGVHLQAASILMMLTGPLLKALLVHFGSLLTLGYFEMASRMVTKVREVIVGAAQVVTPYFSKLAETDRRGGRDAYRRTYRVMAIIAVPSIFSVAVLAPAMSHAWFGLSEGTFVLYTWLLAGGYLANVLSVPAFFANLGSGEVRWNTASHILLIVSVGGVGWGLGRTWGGDGVVVSWVASLIVAAVFLVTEYHRRSRLQHTDILSRRDALVIACNVGVILTAAALGYVLSDVLGIYVTAALQLFVLMLWGLLTFKVYGIMGLLYRQQRRG